MLFRTKLDHIRQSLLLAVEVRMGDLKEAEEKGVDLADMALPKIIVEQCRTSILEAVRVATGKDLIEMGLKILAGKYGRHPKS